MFIELVLSTSNQTKRFLQSRSPNHSVRSCASSEPTPLGAGIGANHLRLPALRASSVALSGAPAWVYCLAGVLEMESVQVEKRLCPRCDAPVGEQARFCEQCG